MLRPFRQFVAVLLAIWLPLFSGNALAASVVMQSASIDCHPAVVQVAAQSHDHHVATGHHHASLHDEQIAEIQDQAAGQHDQQNSSCKDCGICHFACSGFLANFATEVMEIRPLAQVYVSSSTLFQSFTSAPLDPPPLSRV